MERAMALARSSSSVPCEGGREDEREGWREEGVLLPLLLLLLKRGGVSLLLVEEKESLRPEEGGREGRRERGREGGRDGKSINEQ